MALGKGYLCAAAKRLEASVTEGVAGFCSTPATTQGFPRAHLAPLCACSAGLARDQDASGLSLPHWEERMLLGPCLGAGKAADSLFQVLS